MGFNSGFKALIWLFSSPKRRDLPRGSPNLPFCGFRDFFPGLHQQGREVNHLLQCSAEDKTSGAIPLLSLYAFMTWSKKTFFNVKKRLTNFFLVLLYSWYFLFLYWYYSMPHYSMSHYSMPHYNMPHYSMPHYSMPHYSMPHYSMPHYSMPHYSMPHYSMPNYTVILRALVNLIFSFTIAFNNNKIILEVIYTRNVNNNLFII